MAYFYLLLLLLFSCAPMLTCSFNQEAASLHEIKLFHFDDPHNVLSDWILGDSDSPCHWYGLTCDPLTLSVTSIDLSNAHIGGAFPSSLLCRGLPNLTFISFFNNSMNSTLSDDISMCQSLQHLNLSQNLLTGKLPATLPDIPNITLIDFSVNRFSGDIPARFGMFRTIEAMLLSENLLDGVVPAFWGNIWSLKQLDLSYNPFLPSRIPPELGNLTNLEVLLLSSCNLKGEIPDSLARLINLVRLDLSQNNLTGVISASLTDLTRVVEVVLSDNSLSGELPRFGWSNMTALRSFDASRNELFGMIPEELCSLPLESLDLYANDLEGNVPKSIANSPNLYGLRLFANRLTGELPEQLGKNSPLLWIDVSKNQFSGELPATLCAKGVLARVIVMLNNFSDKIPVGLAKCRSLTRVVLDYNNFSGEVPAEFWGLPRDSISFLGNPGLCVKIDGLFGCRANTGHVWLLRSILMLAGLVSVVGWLYWRYRKCKKGKRAADESKWTIMSFHNLEFSEYEILGALNEDNLIEAVAAGKVFKVVLSNGDAVAVKKIWTSSKLADEEEDVERCVSVHNEGFEVQIETFGKVRHKNLVRLWCCCTTKDCKLLVYEYMPNGSLGDVLHSNNSGILDWPTRYKIAMDAAEALSYLHHECVPPIVHRNVKSNNILLNVDFGARVAEFGLAKKVDTIAKGSNPTSVIAGSCAYTAPEYAFTHRLNEKSDIYSFGVVILELVTGRLPLDPEFGDKDLVKWVRVTLDQEGIDHVLDPKLESCFKEEICRVLDIGLLCTSLLPYNRPSMRRVVGMLQEIGGFHSQMKTVKNSNELSPYYDEDASIKEVESSMADRQFSFSQAQYTEIELADA